MSDKYKNIRDREEIELAKKITESNLQLKRTIKKITIFGTIALIAWTVLSIWYIYW